jgi:hypothetical protein
MKLKQARELERLREQEREQQFEIAAENAWLRVAEYDPESQRDDYGDADTYFAREQRDQEDN